MGVKKGELFIEDYVVAFQNATVREHKINSIVEILKDLDLDGETTQDILERIGMDEQMYKQLNVKFGSEDY